MATDGNLINLLGMAKTAAIGGNQQEALTYFNRVLELDPNLSEAWLGKGRAAVWQSTIANIRTGEAIIAFNHAIATSSDETKFAVTTEAVEEINKVVVALYGISRDHLDQFASLDNTWEFFLNQVAQMLEALDQTKNWSPNNVTTLENIVHLCKDNIEGYRFRDQFNGHVPVAYSISPTYEALLRERLDQAVASLRALDASYTAPNIEKKQADACFVVTATMGDFEHPDVVLLRKFRDEWILSQPWGHFFVTSYYRIGPRLAAVIRSSEKLKKLSYHVIVVPAVKFARRRMP
jgi:tetratricopeptide (TPR) repeat protein